MRRLAWDRDGVDWPHRELSAFVSAAGMRWHVQRMGSGPTLLLVHGTAASTHSWSGLAPLLAAHFDVLAMDLPGHGFSEAPPAYRFSLAGMARSLDALLGVLGARPALVVGHSAGAAILSRMCLDRRIAPRALVSLNGALLPFRGAGTRLFSPLAWLLARGGPIPRLIARQATAEGAIERLIRGTGSRLDDAGVERYRCLVGSPGHVAATLAMVGSWDLLGLQRELPGLEARLVLIAASGDRTVLPSEAAHVRQHLVPGADLVSVSGLGHLAHEERPAEIAELIFRAARAEGLLSASSG